MNKHTMFPFGGSVPLTVRAVARRRSGPLATTVMALAMSATAPWFPASGPRSFLFAFGLMIALQLIAVASASRLPWRIHREDATRA